MVPGEPPLTQHRQDQGAGGGFQETEQREHTPISIDKTPVERVNSFKFLGVHITEDLTWSTHTDAVLKKAHQRLFFLRRLRKLEWAPASSDPSTPALWRASWPAASPPGLETAPLATAKLCKGSCELPATLLEVSFPPSRTSTPGGCIRKARRIIKDSSHPSHRLLSLLPSGDVSAASDPALTDWGTAFSLRLSGKWTVRTNSPYITLPLTQHAMHCTLTP